MVLSNIEPTGTENRHAAPVTTVRYNEHGNRYGIEPEHRIAQTVGYMREYLNQSLQVPKLARLANISPSHFFAVFKRQTGFAPMDFFIRLRMQRACEILDSTSMSIKEVAGELGYDDPFYFSRVFKAMSRVAPTEYRRLNEEQRQAIRGGTLPAPNQITPGFNRPRFQGESRSHGG